MTREFFDVKDDDYTDDLSLCVGVWSIIFLVFFCFVLSSDAFVGSLVNVVLLWLDLLSIW